MSVISKTCYGTGTVPLVQRVGVMRVLLARTPPTTIDNRIYNSRLNTPHQLRRRKCPQFLRDKKGGHFERRAAIGRRNTPHHSYTRGSKGVPVCIGAYVILLTFGNISSDCAKEYLITAVCNVLMLAEVEVSDEIAVVISEIRPIGRSGRHF